MNAFSSNNRRWVLYASSRDKLHNFAEAVRSAGAQWRVVAIDPVWLDLAVKTIQPEAVVVAADEPRADSLLRRTHALHGRRRLVVDDRNLPLFTRVLREAGRAQKLAS
jgi:hypothetical protein